MKYRLLGGGFLMLLVVSHFLGMDVPKKGNDLRAPQNGLKDSVERIIPSNPERGLQLADSGFRIAREKNDSFHIGWFINKRGTAHFYLGNLREALKDFKSGLAIGEKLDSSFLKYRGANNTGVIYDKFGKHDSAIKYYQLAFAVSDQPAIRLKKPLILNNLGNLYNSKGQYKTALSYYMKGINMHKKLDTVTSNTRRLYHNIADAHTSLEDLQKAKANYKKALNLPGTPRQSRKANTYGGFAHVYLKQDSLRKAEQYAKKALKLHQELGNKYQLVSDYNSMGILAINRGNFPKALTYLDSASQLADSHEYNKKDNYTTLHKGRVYHKMGEYDRAKTLFSQAIKGAREVEDQNLVSNVYGNLRQTHLKLNDTASALKALKKEKELTESIYKSRYKEDLEGIRSQFKMRRQKQKIKILERENRISELKSERQLDFLYAMGAGILILMAAGGILLKFYRDKQQANDKLKSQNQVIQQQNEELEKAHQQAQNASKAKSDFLASMSHEIRTPMNGVMGMTELLRDTNLNKDQQSYVNTIQKSSETLLTVINDVLDLSRAERGKLAFNYQPFDLHALIQEVTELFQHDLKANDVNLSHVIGSEVPQYVKGDKARIRQILINLVGNAGKFVDEGFIQIRVDNYSQGDNTLQFSVSDSGRGISEEQKANIFEAFNQGENQNEVNSNGLGLGLAISNKLVEQMGGHMSLESHLGEGSTFYFTLSLSPVTDFAEARETPEVDSPVDFDESLRDQYPLAILIAEDNTINQRLITKFLSKFGYQPKVVEDGEQVIQEIKTYPDQYDIIFMDIQMPKKDGVEATQVIQQELQPKKMPVIIALTADAMEGAIDKYLNAGMDDYVSKPFKADAIKTLLQKWGSEVSGNKG